MNEHPDAMHRDMNIVDLKHELTEAQKLMGPGELATRITEAIQDATYLAEVIEQMQENLESRSTKELPF